MHSCSCRYSIFASKLQVHGCVKLITRSSVGYMRANIDTSINEVGGIVIIIVVMSVCLSVCVISQ